MDVELLTRLLARDEGQFLEFKSVYERSSGSLKRRKAADVAWDIAETLSAMANADGGTLLLGVEDDKTITGVDYPDDKLALFRQATQSLLQPPLKAHPAELEHQGKRVLAFEADPSLVPHQLSDGRYLLRVRDQNVPFPAEKIAALKSARASGQYERQFVYEARLEDLDAALLSQFAQRLGDSPSGRRHPLRRLSPVGLDMFGQRPSRSIKVTARDIGIYHPLTRSVS